MCVNYLPIYLHNLIKDILKSNQNFDFIECVSYYCEVLDNLVKTLGWILCTLDTKNNNIICLRRHQIPYETSGLLPARVIITSVIIFITPL